MESATQLRLFRITCIGFSSSGKTSLINSFVNGSAPFRTIPTEHAVVYHRRVEITNNENVAAGCLHDRPFLVEVEDTPGSERAHEGQEDGVESGDGKMRKGDLVNVVDDLGKVKRAFSEHQSMTFRPDIEHVLGRRCIIKHIYKDGTVSVAMQDGAVHELPIGAVEKSTAMVLPIDEFMNLFEKPSKQLKTLKDRKTHNQNLLLPFSAYERPSGNPGMDKTLTRNRMGFFICFDMSDETGESVNEALVLHRMLWKRVEKMVCKTVLPIIWLVGCKADKRGVESVVRNNTQVAKSFSEDAEIPFYVTSARNHQGVQEVFRDMVSAIQERQQLWNLTSADGDAGGEQGEGGYCSQQ